MEGIKPFLLFFVPFLINVISCDVIVDTSSGKVAGVEVKSILKDEKFYSFMGIPYAKPPVGDLKFTAPQPHEGWTEVLDAKREKKPCSQMNMPIRNLKTYGFCGQDDCLTLSIHTPKLPKNAELSLPVMVFLFDEHFRVTHNSSKDYGPDFIVKEDVILVTINYRLGSLGFISFEDETLPGNNGLRDIILGLKWLQQNIHNFGGDPYRFTLMGVSGGAALTDILLHSSKAKGLFSGAILQSGTALNSMYIPRKPKAKAEALAKELKKKAVTSANLLQEFKTLSSFDIVTSELLSIETDESREYQTGTVAFGPVPELEHPGAIITHFPEERPLDIDIPIMIGYNSREGIEMSERFLRKPQYLTFADRDFLLVLPLRTGYRFDTNSNVYRHAIDEIKEFYFDEGYVKISKPGEYLTYIADVTNFYSIDYAVRKYVNETSTPIYYYTFDYSGELNMRKNIIMKETMTMEGTWGAAASDELCYLFVCKPIKKLYNKVLEDEDSEELKVIRSMIKLWTNFAKSGNPTPEGSDFTWTPVTQENKECLVISDELQMKTNVHGDRIKFWDDFIAKYRQQAIDGVVKDEKDEL